MITGIYNVADYGGSIQAAIDAVPAAPAGRPAGGGPYDYSQGGEVYIPAGTYRQQKPLLIQKTNIRLRGVGPRYNCSVIATSNDVPGQVWYGPLLVVAPAGNPPPMAPAILQGSGQALALQGGMRGHFNLRDIDTLSVDGLANFCLECTYQPGDNSPSNVAGLVVSSGRRLSVEGQQSAFGLYQDTQARIQAQLRVGTNPVTLRSAAGSVAAGGTYHLALTYDGNTIRLFVGGTLAAQASASGAISQNPSEDVTVGPVVYDWPEANFLMGSAVGTLDGLRVSNTARYTDTFTPPASKPACDRNTLLLVNFDNQQDLFSVGLVGTTGYPSGVPAWLPWRTTATPNEVFYVTLQDLAFLHLGTWGPFFHHCREAELRNLHVQNGSTGPALINTCYLSKVADVKVMPTGIKSPSGRSIARYGLAVSAASGAFSWRHINVSGFAYGLVLVQASGTLTDVFLATERDSVCNALLKGLAGGNADLVITNLEIDDEASAPPDHFEANLMVSDMDNLLMLGGGLEVTSAVYGQPLVIVSGGKCLGIWNTGFHVRPDTKQVFSMARPPAQPIDFKPGVLFGGTPPWGV